MFTTLLTVVIINLAINLIHKGHDNSWIFVTNPNQKKVNLLNRCEHKPSLFSNSFIAKFFKKRWAHFAIILPSFIVFYIVMIAGIIGEQNLNSSELNLVNFAPDISWLLWFPLLWLLTWIANGRTWCQTCPFSGQAEWLQRLHPWKKTGRKLGKRLRWPLKYSTILYSAIGFSVLTWVEEFYNIGGPGLPMLTSVVLIYIALLEVIIAILFQERTFCRTICPLSAPLAVTTMISPLGTFRIKDQEKCKSCTTKDCMRGNDKFHGCPWFASPGSRENVGFCGMASDCYKACPHDNIDVPIKRFPWIDDLFANRKRFDFALSVLILLGVVFFQFFNALPVYTILDQWLSQVTGWGNIANALGEGLGKYGWTTYGYPMPLDYAFLNAIPIIIVSLFSFGKDFKWRFTSISYSLIPIFAATILARNIPKFVGGSLLILNEVFSPTGIHTPLAETLWGSMLYKLGSNPCGATAEWWALLIMEAINIFGIYLSVRAAKKLSEYDGIPMRNYLLPIIILGVSFVLITYWMSSPMNPAMPFYNKYLGNLLYNPLQAEPPF
ncbi:hypothetical protein HS5_05500 [Acidianus sp. HS-5]|nr:hypothetical protein HS5_05500 [Acidianus sp. HS-5]